MNRAVQTSLSDVNLVLFVVDGTNWTADDERWCSLSCKSQLPSRAV